MTCVLILQTLFQDSGFKLSPDEARSYRPPDRPLHVIKEWLGEPSETYVAPSYGCMLLMRYDCADGVVGICCEVSHSVPDSVPMCDNITVERFKSLKSFEYNFDLSDDDSDEDDLDCDEGEDESDEDDRGD